MCLRYLQNGVRPFWFRLFFLIAFSATLTWSIYLALADVRYHASLVRSAILCTDAVRQRVQVMDCGSICTKTATGCDHASVYMEVRTVHTCILEVCIRIQNRKYTCSSERRWGAFEHFES